MPVIARIKYEYQDEHDHIRVIDSYPENHRALHFEDSLQGTLNLSALHEPVLEYIALMAEGGRQLQPLPKSILLGGLGSCGLLHAVNYWWRHQARIQTVEYSERIRDIARRFFRLRSSDEVILGDLRTVMESGTLPLADLVMIDCYNSSSIPAHLTTYQFMKCLYHSMTPRGVATFNLWSPTCNEMCGDQLRTMMEVFGKVGLASCYDEQNVVGYVCKDPLAEWPGSIMMKGKRYDLRFMSKNRPNHWPAYLEGTLVITDENVHDLYDI